MHVAAVVGVLRLVLAIVSARSEVDWARGLVPYGVATRTEDEEYDDGPYPNAEYNAHTYDMESEADFPWDEVLGGVAGEGQVENTETEEPARKRRRTA